MFNSVLILYRINFFQQWQFQQLPQLSSVVQQKSSFQFKNKFLTSIWFKGMVWFDRQSSRCVITYGWIFFRYNNWFRHSARQSLYTHYLYLIFNEQWIGRGDYQRLHTLHLSFGLCGKDKKRNFQRMGKCGGKSACSYYGKCCSQKR